MIYGPDDKPIMPEFVKSIRTLTETYYRKSLLKHLESKLRFTDYWGPRLCDAKGNQHRLAQPAGASGLGSRYGDGVDVNHEAAEALGYRVRETSEIEVPRAGSSSND
jgi:hypothetical protein